MPLQELPEEFLRPHASPTNSSLSSNSSDVILINAHYMRSVSVSSTTTNDDSYFEPISSDLNQNNRNRNSDEIEEEEEEEATYQPIKLPTEPTLEELLVNFKHFLNTFLKLFIKLSFSAKLQAVNFSRFNK
jgi:hypothetical protein